jgi:predicted MFS family arabinose efflux permease
MGIPRVFAASITGWLAQWLGWTGFFTFCTLIAVPGLLLLLKFAPQPPAQEIFEIDAPVIRTRLSG